MSGWSEPFKHQRVALFSGRLLNVVGHSARGLEVNLTVLRLAL